MMRDPSGGEHCGVERPRADVLVDVDRGDAARVGRAIWFPAAY
jgi:hypothetical protein